MLDLGIYLSKLLTKIFFKEHNKTFSAKNYELYRAGKKNYVKQIDAIFSVLFGHKDHCLKSWIWWVTKDRK